MWHVKNWFRVGKKFSWRLSFNTLAAFIGLSDALRNRFLIARANSKHEYILSFLEREFSEIISRYKDIDDTKNINKPAKKIWMLWWQGIENAPPLVRACMNSTIRNAGDAEVTVLTKENISDYIQVPEYIIRLQKEGKMSMANMTDLIRVMLLARYGGIWLDSTIYTSGQIPEDYFTLPFYSLHTHYEENCYVQHNLYHIFILGSRPEGKLVSFVRDIFLEYWKRFDCIIDYFMLDYILMLAYNCFDDIRSEIDNLPYSSERLYDLVKMLSKPYDPCTMEILRSECMFSKLDWHKKYKTKAKGTQTYYSHLINAAGEAT